MLPIKIILHPTDFSSRSEYALRLAGSLAGDYDARLVLLHVVPPPVVVPMEVPVPYNAEESKARVEAALKERHPPDWKVEVERRIAHGDPVTEIILAARETGADIIVMGTHGWSGLSRLLMGSVAEGVARKAPCPVLTVRMPEPGEKSLTREAHRASAPAVAAAV